MIQTTENFTKTKKNCARTHRIKNVSEHRKTANQKENQLNVFEQIINQCLLHFEQLSSKYLCNLISLFEILTIPLIQPYQKQKSFFPHYYDYYQLLVVWHYSQFLRADPLLTRLSQTPRSTLQALHFERAMVKSHQSDSLRGLKTVFRVSHTPRFSIFVIFCPLFFSFWFRAVYRLSWLGRQF